MNTQSLSPNAGPVQFDAQSFILNGERVFLTSGALHYFRIPRPLWRDRLEKARLMGLNTVQLYFAWNWHEPSADEFLFDGYRDVDEFLSECERQGLWVVARPGPYICAEWDGGGFPAWLYNIEGLRVRRDNAPFLERVAKYWGQLLPIIARHQIHHGGRVILMQLENELGLVLKNNPDEAERYMNALRQIALDNGIQVPFITCEGGVDWAIECVNAFEPTKRAAQYREHQPQVPLHSTEFWSGWYDQWDKPAATMPGWSMQQWQANSGEGTPFDPRFIERETWRQLAYGFGGYDYYMWHGGTNFGYWGNYGQTTGYDYTAPLSEAGGLSPKYFAARRVALFAQTFATLLTNAPAEVQTVASGVEEVSVYRRSSEKGALLFLDNEGAQKRSVSVALANGETALVEVPSRTCLHLVDGADVCGVRLTTDAQLLTANEAARALILYGEIGQSVRVQVNEQATIIPIAPGYPQSVTYDGVTIHILPRALAERAWWVRNQLVVGPYLVREDGEKAILSWPDAHGEAIDAFICAANDTHWRALEVPRATLPPAPMLENWQIARADDELVGGDQWREIGPPTNRIRLAGHLSEMMGYAWYCHEISSESDRTARLRLSALADRALLFVNGAHLQTTTAPPEERDADPSLEADIRLQAGDNTIAVLTDNLGHLKGAWQIRIEGEMRPHEQDAKGLFGPTSLDGEQLASWKFVAGTGFERGVVPAWSDVAPSGPLKYFRTTFALSPTELDTENRELWIDVSALGKGVIWVNNHNIGRYWNINGHSKYFVPKCWLQQQNEIVIFEESARDLLDAHAVHLVWDRYAVAAISEL